LSTASAIEPRKRTNALEAWTKVLREKYGVMPKFMHSDKDMAEIGMCQNVWPEAKVQLCWWHIRRAVRTRLRGNLPTSPYNVRRAHKEYAFIENTFYPYGKSNLDDTELLPDEANAELAQHKTITEQPNPNSLYIRIPNLPLSNAVAPAPPAQTTSSHPILPIIPSDSSDKNAEGGAQTTWLIIRVPAHFQIAAKEEHGDLEAEKTIRHTFCPDELQGQVIDMMERHLCAHPLIPGYSAPSPEGIKEWAVKQMYQFCKAHDLPNLWAYLWENWYRSGRWELWARCVVTEIPRLKTTMMVEAQ
jgi:hypothetical protein